MLQLTRRGSAPPGDSATRITGIAVGPIFSRRAAELCAFGQKFLTYGIPMPPWLRKTRAVPLAIIASIATEYRARQCMTFRPHRLAIPRDRKSRWSQRGFTSATPCKCHMTYNISSSRIATTFSKTSLSIFQNEGNAQYWPVVGLLSQFPPFRYFPKFSAFSKHMLAIEHHAYIWQVSPQFSCGDTCHTLMWFKEFNRYFHKFCLRRN